jgi:hypothetical protein
VTRPIRHKINRRAALEPVIGHLKAEHRMDRNYLKGRDGDRANAMSRRRRLKLRPSPSLAEEACCSCRPSHAAFRRHRAPQPAL